MRINPTTCRSVWMSLFCLLISWMMPAARAQKLENDRYRVEAMSNPIRLTVTRVDQAGVSAVIRPRLEVFYSERDPGLAYAGLRKIEVTSTAAWQVGDSKQLEPDLYRAMKPLAAEAKEIRILPGRIEVTVGESGRVTATLPEGSAPPGIEWQWTAPKAGFYAVAFTGLGEQDPEALEFCYQPLVWSWRRFPAGSYVTSEQFATTAATFRTREGITEGLAVVPLPYRFARLENSLFGLFLRSESGAARPAVLAPLPGGEGSRKEAGEQLSFQAVYVLSAGGWQAGVKFLLRDIIGLRNERENATVSLNQTLENMLDFGMDDAISGWVADKRGFDYRFDVPGTVKVVSSLHALGMALLTGESEIYRRRALPLMEYVISREKYLWAESDSIKSQSPSHFLRGPCVEVAELASLSEMLGGKSPVFREEAKRIYGKTRKLNLNTETGATWQDALAMYRLTGSAEYLEKARASADRQIEEQLGTLPRDFETNPSLRDKQSAFYTDYGPKWFDIFELYEVTKDKKHLDAAAVSARQMLLWLRSNPMAPPGLVTVNKGGRVPGVFRWRRTTESERVEIDSSMEAPEQRIPAWRTSLVGLPPEQGYTYAGGGPIMITHHAAWMLRLAHLTGEALFADAAYNAVLGRYANFPGYYFTSLETDIYQRPEYPLRSYQDFKYNALFYNHIWPHIALVADFLISDAWYRSQGEVDFPSAYAPGYAYLTSKVYGHRPGKAYGQEGVLPWLPKGGIRISSIKVNWLLGVAENDLWVFLMNTAAQEIIGKVELDAGVIPWNADGRYPLRTYPGDAEAGWLSDGSFPVTIPARGFRAVRISGLRVNPAFQRRLAMAPKVRQGYDRMATGDGALGTLTSMLFQAVPEYTDFYVYSDATEKDAARMKLHYTLAGGRQGTMEDREYPFEFSLRLSGPDREIRFAVESVRHDGTGIRSQERALSSP